MITCYSYVTRLQITTRIHVFLDGRVKCECGGRYLRHITPAPPADSDQLPPLSDGP